MPYAFRPNAVVLMTCTTGASDLLFIVVLLALTVFWILAGVFMIKQAWRQPGGSASYLPDNGSRTDVPAAFDSPLACSAHMSVNAIIAGLCLFEARANLSWPFGGRPDDVELILWSLLIGVVLAPLTIFLLDWLWLSEREGPELWF
jgi:hypothetical protein